MLATSIRPADRSASRLAMASPKPFPSISRVSGRFSRKKSSKIRGRFCGRIPSPVSTTSIRTSPWVRAALIRRVP